MTPDQISAWQTEIESRSKLFVYGDSIPNLNCFVSDLSLAIVCELWLLLEKFGLQDNVLNCNL